MSWEFFTKYKDVFANGLDLLSFLLITPQLVRLVAPVFGEMFRIFAGLTIVSSLFLLIAWGSDIIANWWLSKMLFGTGFIVVVMVAFLVKLAGPMLETWASNLITRAAFVLGIAIFLTSRLLALTIALHEVAPP
jgi:hypothetical protein